MKRNEIIKKLVEEGFSEKTLVQLNDKQINLLADRIIGEQVATTSVTTPASGTLHIPKTNVLAINKAKQNKQVFDTYEGEVKEENEEETTEAARTLGNQNRKGALKGMKYKAGRPKFLENQEETDIKGKTGVKKVSEPSKVKTKIATKLPGKFEQKPRPEKLVKGINESPELSEVKNWVTGLVEANYRSLTTKNEIMELISTKLTEQAEPEIAEPTTAPITRPRETPAPDQDDDPFIDPWQEPGNEPDAAPKFEKVSQELPHFLTFKEILNSVNESKVDLISSIIMAKIKKRK